MVSVSTEIAAIHFTVVGPALLLVTLTVGRNTTTLGQFVASQWVDDEMTVLQVLDILTDHQARPEPDIR